MQGVEVQLKAGSLPINCKPLQQYCGILKHAGLSECNGAEFDVGSEACGVKSSIAGSMFGSSIESSQIVDWFHVKGIGKRGQKQGQR